MVAETTNKLEKGMHVGSKKQVKFTVRLEDLLPGSVQVFTEQCQLSEDQTIPSAILKVIDAHPDTVFVFNRGVQSRKAYEDITRKEGMSFLFLSNMKDVPVEDIIMIYKKRWDIEVFFRFIKQELNFSHFISTNVNGINVIVYMTLILSMLVHIYKTYNNIRL